MIRLQKFLADCGICSRRKAEEFILAGKVIVNGKIVLELGGKINPEKDIVIFENKIIKYNNHDKVYIMFHKPEGCITTSKEQFNRKTVLDYININVRVVPVGRLDYDTSGLLILTNDGDLTYKLTHPKHNIRKKYIAKIVGNPSKEKLNNFEKGLIIDNYKTAPASIKIIEKQPKTSIVEIIISEGKNRQIRKMCKTIGHSVLELKRVSIENLTLGNLEKGKFRYLTSGEINYLKNF